jgi:hypothetical protein
MATAAAPALGAWTTLYDSAGQAPNMIRSDSANGLFVSFKMDRMSMTLQGDEDAPFAGAIGLSGTLSASMPEDFELLGFLLVVNCHVAKTAGSQALVACSIGHGTDAVAWPVGSPEGTPSVGLSRTREEPANEDSLFEKDFRMECFTSDFNPAMVGVPPHPPLPPFPITMSMQARRRAADETVYIGITEFEVRLVR